VSAGHAHDDDQGASFDWFQVLDVFVWVAVALIAGLAAEWLIGWLIREKMAAGASKFLKVGATTPAVE
jgi:hypothetical protein